MQVLKVSARSVPNAVAGAIANIVRNQGEVELQAVGAGAANQALKAVVVAREFLTPAGVDLVCVPSFTQIEIDQQERTALRMVLGPR